MNEIDIHAEGQKVWLGIRRNTQPQVDALLDAGWKFFPVSDDSEPWQWYWRKPPVGKRKQGRLFLSTQQAFNFLQKCQSA